MPETNETLLTPAGREHIVKLLEITNLSTNETGFRLNDLTALGTLISDEESLKMLVGKMRTDYAKLNDQAEAYISKMFTHLGPMNNGYLPSDFTMGLGGRLWEKLKNERIKAGRPELKLP